MGTIIYLYFTSLFSLLFLTDNVVSFEGIWSRGSFSKPRRHLSRSWRHVAIYTWDDDGKTSFQEDDPLQTSSSITSTTVLTHRSEVMDCLSREHVAELARLATAFSPPDRALALKNIEHVEVMDVDDHHIEIEAVVRQDEGLAVALSVPIDFPHQCIDADDFTDCVLHQVEELDHLAEDRLHELEWEVSHQDKIEQRWLELMGGENIANLPSWWVFPSLVPGMAEECESMQQLLNEQSFQEDLKSQATRTLLENHPHGHDLFVEQVAVVRTGPAGLYLRVRAKLLRLLQECDEELLLDVFLKFNQEALTVSAFREAVVGVIETA
jgi:hypothetical protein